MKSLALLRSQKGLTLLELVLAMTMLAVVGVGSVGLGSFANRLIDMTRQNKEVQSTTMELMRVFEDDMKYAKNQGNCCSYKYYYEEYAGRQTITFLVCPKGVDCQGNDRFYVMYVLSYQNKIRDKLLNPSAPAVAYYEDNTQLSHYRMDPNLGPSGTFILNQQNFYNGPMLAFARIDSTNRGDFLQNGKYKFESDLSAFFGANCKGGSKNILADPVCTAKGPLPFFDVSADGQIVYLSLGMIDTMKWMREHSIESQGVTKAIYMGE